MFSFFRPSKAPRIELLREKIGDIVPSGITLDDLKMSADGQLIVVLHVADGIKPSPTLSSQIEAHLLKSDGVKKVAVILTNERKQGREMPNVAAPSHSSDMAGLPKTIIAVASGKGGVGKSTVAVNLAVALSQKGYRVGILDADIYGPSLPRLLGVADKKAAQEEDGRLIPISAHGLKAMSMGFLVDEKTPMIWRGPMAQSALLQMLRDVNWDGLDILVIDMPPGTGDVHLTLAQRVKLSGGVVVSTPQDIALIDARKGLEMFQKVAVPILGIVENMSYYCCPQCGHRDDIFGHGGARAEAEKIGVPFLGEIPLHGAIRTLSDAGTPVTLSATQSEQAHAFHSIAERVISGLSTAQRPAPIIRIEE